VRDFHSSVDKSDLVNSFDFRGESSVDAEDFTFDNSSDTKIIEDLSAVLPRIGIPVLSNGLVIETVHGGDLSSLVVSSQEGDVSWILELQAEEKLECLDRVEASVHEVTHEDVSGVGDLASLVE